MNAKTIRKLIAVGTMLLGLTVTGCNSSTTGGGGDEDGEDGHFIATDDAAGSIELEVFNIDIPVAGLSKFRVKVRDSNGGAVPHINVFCDSERGLAITEPTRGFELTDTFGDMSGEVGCEQPGSFQLVCRLPVGANKRDFVTIHCEGNAPTGFEGFPGAAGGGLGGGVVTVDDEGEDSTFGVRVTEVQFNDGGQSNTLSIDIVQVICDATATPVEYEFFTDTEAFFTIQNNSNQITRFTSFSYVVEDYDGTGTSFFSETLKFIGDVEQTTVDANGGEATLRALFIDADSAPAGVSGAVGGKRYYGLDHSLNPNTDERGFKNVRFTLNGINTQGESVTAKFSTAISLDNFDRCP